MMENGEQPAAIGKYEITGRLGRGAMGVVYEARDPEIGRTVAIKVLRKITGSPVFAGESALERFRMEARSAGNLRHPNIITIFEVNTDSGDPYIVMDYIEGEPLDQRIERLGRLKARDAIHILRQVAAGLDYAHARGVVHRDVKPSNVIIDDLGHVFILDFGVANIGEAQSGSDPEPVIGTPSYMSPEQIANQGVDYRTDLFALAVVSFECLSGKRPFAGPDCTTVLTNILKGARRDLTEAAPELPLALEVEFDRAFSQEKDERFTSAGEMIRAFSKALSVGEGESSGIPVEGAKRGAIESARQREIHAEVIRSWPPSPGNVLFGDAWQRSSDLRSSDSVSSDSEKTIAVATDPSLSSHRKPRFPAALIVFGILCLALGGFLVVHLLTSVPASPDAAPDFSQMSLHDFSSDAAVPEAGGAPSAAEKSPASSTDAELIGIIMNLDGSDPRAAEAIREGARRKIVNLLSALMVAARNDSYLIRIEALKAMAELNDRRATGAIVTHLADYDALVRRKAVEVLARLGDKRAIGHLQLQLARESEPAIAVEIRSVIKRLTEAQETLQ